MDRAAVPGDHGLRRAERGGLFRCRGARVRQPQRRPLNLVETGVVAGRCDDRGQQPPPFPGRPLIDQADPVGLLGERLQVADHLVVQSYPFTELMTGRLGEARDLGGARRGSKREGQRNHGSRDGEALDHRAWAPVR